MSNGDELKGMSIEERAAMGVTDEMDDMTLFPDGVLSGDPWTLGQIHKSKKPIEVTASLSKAEVPMTGGLPDPSKIRRVMVRTGHVKYEVIPEYEEQPDGTEDIVAYKIRANMRTAYVEPIGGAEDMVVTEFERLMIEDRQRAAEVADKLVKLASGAEVE